MITLPLAFGKQIKSVRFFIKSLLSPSFSDWVTNDLETNDEMVSAPTSIQLD